MRVILIATVALLVGCGLMGNEVQASQVNQYASQTFTISKPGTLLELIDADGKSRKKVTGDGFKLNYKTRGKSRSASAIGTKTKQLLTSSEPAKFDGNTVTVVVHTADKSLEITSRLTYDAEAGELIIKRKFRNISEDLVIVESIRNHFDPKVLFRGPFNRYDDLVSRALNQFGARLAGNVEDCGPGQCLPPPECPKCPNIVNPNWNLNNGYLTARLEQSKPQFVVGWSQQPITLKPRDEMSIAIRVVMS